MKFKMRCAKKSQYVVGGEPLRQNVVDSINRFKALTKIMGQGDGGDAIGLGLGLALKNDTIKLWSVSFSLDSECATFFESDPRGDFEFDALPQAVADQFEIGKYYDFEIKTAAESYQDRAKDLLGDDNG